MNHPRSHHLHLSGSDSAGPDARVGRTRWIHALCALVLATIALALIPTFTASASAAELGVSPDLTWGTSSADQVRTVGALQDIGARWVRLNIEWSAAEPTPGVYDQWMLEYYDHAVQLAHDAGLKVLMLVSRSPQWASGSTNKESPPRNPADLARFLRVMAARYAGKVSAWEIWNEENISRFWPQGPNPRAYTALLKAAYPAVKAGDPAAKVVFGGLSTNDYAFVAGAYAAGAKGYFDVMATHPYSCQAPEKTWLENGRISGHAFLGYRPIRALMLANGDDKPLWFTEFGWGTTSAQCGVSPTTQASYLTRAVQLANQDRYVGVALYYNLRNNYWGKDANDTEDQYGLMRTDFTPKPAYAAFKALARPTAVASASATAAASAPLASAAATALPAAARPKVSVGVRRLTRASAQIVGSQRLKVFGKVSGARGGRVALRLCRSSACHQPRLLRLRFASSGRFARTVALPRGGWRLRGFYKPPAQRRAWGSRLVRFRV